MIEYGPFDIQGYSLQCAHCGGKSFLYRPGQPDAAGGPRNLAWLAAADVYACRACGRLHFFVPEVVSAEVPPEARASDDAPLSARNLEEAVADDEAAAPTDCLACGALIPARSHTCPACGWTYLHEPPRWPLR